MSKARAEEYNEGPGGSGGGAGCGYRRLPTIVSLTRPVVGRTMTLPVGTRLVGVHKVQKGLWVVLFNGAQFRAHAEPVEIPG
jgi:hypothetical protein